MLPLPKLAASSAMLFVILFSATLASAFQIEKRTDAASTCAAAGVVHARTTLYFGLARPAGTITEKQWKAFVSDEVTLRFPQGFTIWEAKGQWQGADGQIKGERSKVLLLVHEDTSLFAIPSYR